MPGSSSCTLHLWRQVERPYAQDFIDLQRSWFLVLYAVGIVELELESTSALVLLIFVIPLAFTLSGFLLWIMYALNGMHPIVCLSCMFSFHSSYNCPTQSKKATIQAVHVREIELYSSRSGIGDRNILCRVFILVLWTPCGRYVCRKY